MVQTISERPVQEASTADLIGRATEQISTLIRDELALAKAEIAAKGRHAGLGIGLFGGASFIALYALGALIAAGILGIAAAGVSPWLAALLVGVGLLLLAGLLGLVGRRHMQRIGPAVPQGALDGIRADLDTMTTAAARGRNHG